jgi:cytochrome c biogenesis protein CcmG/thiol:disulfide interchange protein DsbE
VNWKRATIAAATAAPVIALFGWGLTRDPNSIPSPLPGREAPQFALQVFAPGQGDLTRPIGETVRLADLRGKVVVLNFWASWCLACRDEHAALSEVATTYAGKPVQFLGVLYNDVPDKGTAWIAEMGGQSYPSVDDPGARVAIDYGLYGVPETFFVDANGRVAYKHTGPVTPGIVRLKVDSLMAAAQTDAASPASSGATVPAMLGSDSGSRAKAGSGK